MVIRVTHTSWFQRLGGSIKGIVVGLVFAFAAIPLLFWNEGRAVKTARGLKEGAAHVQSLSADVVDPTHEGDLIHFSGMARVYEPVRDDDFGVEMVAIRLIRHVEMYQWKETKESKTRDKIGGGTETVTTYRYEKGWDRDWINSNRFEEKSGHANPVKIPIATQKWQAERVTVGEFQLPETLVNKIHTERGIIVDVAKIPAPLNEKVVPGDNGPTGANYIYWSESTRPDLLKPEVGDVRIWFTFTPETDVSVIARQTGSTLEPYQTAAGTSLNMLSVGTLTAESMIHAAEVQNKTLTWVLRLVGTLVMFIGVRVLMRPLEVLADFFPFLGALVSLGTTLVAGIVAIGGSLMVISFAWLLYRPMIGAPILLIGIVLIALLYRSARRTEKRSASSPPVLEPEVR